MQMIQCKYIKYNVIQCKHYNAILCNVINTIYLSELKYSILIQYHAINSTQKHWQYTTKFALQ